MITFTDSYRAYFKEYVSEEICQATLSGPDFSQDFSFGRQDRAKKYSLFVKMVSINEKHCFSWVLCESSDEVNTVMIALKLPARISKPLDPKKPIAMLEKFLEKNGTTVHSGHKTSKFIFHDVFKSNVDYSQGLWSIKPQGDECVLNAFVQSVKYGGVYITESFMVFALNLNRYREWASS